MEKKKFCIVGTSGFGRETLTCLIDVMSNTALKIEDAVVFLDEDGSCEESTLMGIPVIKKNEFVPQSFKVVVAIGDPKTRKKVVEALPPETEFTSIVHPSAVISQWVEVGQGSIITAGAVLTCNINIGKHAHINLHTTIGHDCTIGDYFTTAPATNISGNCEFGDYVYLGTNSSVRQGIKICNDVTIGMGGIVVKNIDEEGVYIGNPVSKLGRK
ncbi:acetyltransferase [Ningiella sp. W23]|uniref:acetyltransferase n=1 Tax=Ningiella sp. W23 TaxID=3023715 RepID=UPI003756CC21